ncbi:hypothetical protein ACK9YZ_10135 [Rhizobium sp. ZK1]|uniref:hypothetical protein n=1 Tax=Rhizobium sp. ZK1 TaxID=3389872 RepID=UPI0039F6C58E
MRIFAIALGMLMAFMAAASAFGQEIKEDPSCAEVNYAYVVTRSTELYGAKFYDVLPDGPRQFAEMYVDWHTAFYKTMDASTWDQTDRSGWSPLDRFGPKFRSCVLADENGEQGNEIRHFTATWHQFPYSAYADIWISVRDKWIVRVERRSMHPSEFKFGTTSGTVLEVFDYDRARVAAAYGLGTTPISEDPSCAEVNYAYAATRSSRLYSEKLYDVRKDGAGKQYAEMRIDRDTLYYRPLKRPDWDRFPRANWSLKDAFGPKFQSCKFEGEHKEGGGKVRRYSGKWQDNGVEADMNVWISSRDKRFIRVERRFKNPEYPNKKFGTTEGTTLEVFDFKPATGIAPKQTSASDRKVSND